MSKGQGFELPAISFEKGGKAHSSPAILKVQAICNKIVYQMLYNCLFGGLISYHMGLR